MIIKIFSGSIINLFHNIKLWVFIYIAQLIPGLIIALPAAKSFNSFAGKSKSLQSIFTGGITATPITEFLSYHKDIKFFAGELLLWFLIFFLLFSIFIKGGLISQLSKKGKHLIFPDFLKNSASFFPIFLKIALVSLVFIFLVILLNIPLSLLCRKISGDSEPLIALFILLRLLINVCIFIVIKIAFDYAQISSVLTKNNRAIKSVKNGWKFVSQYPFKTLGLFFVYLFSFVIITLFYSLINGLISADTKIGCISFILWQQIFIFIRAGLILGFISAEVQLFSQHEIPFLKWWYSNEAHE